MEVQTEAETNVETGTETGVETGTETSVEPARPMEVQGVKYAVDIVLCIDATGSMKSIIERVKGSALRFYDDLVAAMRSESKVIDALRLRAIEFRDFYVEGEVALRQSDFFTLPDQKDGFSEFIRSIRADGGGDDAESGLEALAAAIRSNWTKSGDKRRQIVVVWTDTSAHQLEHSADAKPATYPADMPKNLDELTDLWEGQSWMSGSAKRLVMFAPDAYPWTDIATNWDNVVHHTSKAGEGLADHDYKEILDAIARSV